jgi:predicted NBD/HSP70 family sugar kinase
LSLSRPAAPVVAVDFGHNHVRVALARGSNVLSEVSREIDVDHLPAGAMDLAVTETRALLADAEIDLRDVAVVAAGVPAPIDNQSNVVAAVNVLPAWIGFNPHDQLADRLGRPTIIRNDAEMGALGELHFGAAVGERDFLYVKASHGIGASLVLDGRVYRGSRGAAGELGHLQLAGMTDLCRCGKRGCVEAILGAGQIAQRLTYVLRDDGGPVGGDAEMIKLAARTPAGARVLADAGRSLGRLLAEVCMVLDPEAIIIGGSLGAAGTPLLEGAREAISRYTGDASASEVSVRAAALGDRSELMGAIVVASIASADLVPG